MPYNPDGSFSLTYTFGTGTAPDNQFPNKVGQSLNDMATSIAIGNLFSQTATATVAVTFASLVVGAPTGGNEGAGSINAQSIYINGTSVSTGSALLIANDLSELTGTASTARSNISAAAKAQTEFETGSIWGNTGNNTYPIIQNIPFGATITQFTALIMAGTVTATLNINSTPVTGGAINLNSGSQTVTPSGANVMSATDTLKIVTSSSASGNTLLWLVAYTRALA